MVEQESGLSREAAPEGTGPMEKVTLVLGEDTSRKLDEMVEWGRFGSRGRALDALLDSLSICVTELEYWDLAFRHYAERGSLPETQREAQNQMFHHVERVRDQLMRFFQVHGWETPRLPWEEDAHKLLQSTQVSRKVPKDRSGGLTGSKRRGRPSRVGRARPSD